MVKGGLVLHDEEINAVLQGLFEQSFDVSGPHNQLPKMWPREGHGNAVQLAQVPRAAFDQRRNSAAAEGPRVAIGQ